ncbi:LCP family protein [Streptomyces sp. x-80]|uniref:LCP family protein n=1 Tax=Streptomyces sp. x-80 TaxID=2789282 RepID=UPI003980F7A1
MGSMKEPLENHRSLGKRIRRVACWAVAGAVVAVGGLGAFAYMRLDSNLKSIDIGDALGKDRPKDYNNGSQDILVLGSDSRSGANKDLAGGDTGGTARADTAMVVHVPAGQKKASVVSIPRDTLVTRPECTTKSGKQVPAANRVMFNSIYGTGGPACVVKTIEQHTGIRMDHFIEIDFAGFKRLIDALGGITISIDKPIHDKSSGLELQAGTHRLDGSQSLAFVRTRHGIGDGSDLGRIELQQKFILALLSEVERQNLLTSPAKLFLLADSATRSLTTDSQLSSLVSLMNFGKSLKHLGPATTELITLPVVADTADPNRVVPALPQAEELWKALKADQPIPASAKTKKRG